MKLDNKLHQTAKSIYEEEGYTATVEFLYRRGYTREDAQAYAKYHFVLESEKDSAVLQGNYDSLYPGTPTNDTAPLKISLNGTWFQRLLYRIFG